MLEGIGPSVAQGRDTILLREILDKASTRLANELKDQPDIQAGLLDTLGNVYEQLGDYAKAEIELRVAIKLKSVEPGKEDTKLATLIEQQTQRIHELERENARLRRRTA